MPRTTPISTTAAAARAVLGLAMAAGSSSRLLLRSLVVAAVLSAREAVLAVQLRASRALMAAAAAAAAANRLLLCHGRSWMRGSPRPSPPHYTPIAAAAEAVVSVVFQRRLRMSRRRGRPPSPLPLLQRRWRRPAPRRARCALTFNSNWRRRASRHAQTPPLRFKLRSRAFAPTPRHASERAWPRPESSSRGSRSGADWRR